MKSLTDVEVDPHLMELTEPFERSTQMWLDKPIGQVQGDMTIADPFQARVQKHSFIEFIQQVQMEASGVDISVTSLLSNESKGFSSTITMRDIVSNYVFPNTLEVLELSGSDILEALEKNASYFMVASEEILKLILHMNIRNLNILITICGKGLTIQSVYPIQLVAVSRMSPIKE